MIYSYACRACPERWEASEPIAAEPQRECPHCGAFEAYREIGPANGFCLRGGGWAIDGYWRPKSKQVPHVRKAFPVSGTGKERAH